MSDKTEYSLMAASERDEVAFKILISMISNPKISEHNTLISDDLRELIVCRAFKIADCFIENKTRK